MLVEVKGSTGTGKQINLSATEVARMNARGPQDCYLLLLVRA
jgi:hypothetical protein